MHAAAAASLPGEQTWRPQPQSLPVLDTVRQISSKFWKCPKIESGKLGDQKLGNGSRALELCILFSVGDHHLDYLHRILILPYGFLQGLHTSFSADSAL